MGYELRPYQAEAIEAIEQQWKDGNRKTLLVMATGCHAKGESLLLANGKTKKVEDICDDDLLMGDDGKPRKILVRHHGTNELYKIIEKKTREEFVVTKEHILTLIDKEENLIDVTVEKYLNFSDEKKAKYSLAKSKCIKKFSSYKDYDLPFTPYILGSLITNGTYTQQGVMRIVLRNKNDIHSFINQGEKVGVGIKHFKDNSYYVIGLDENKKSEFKKLLHRLGLDSSNIKERFIPEEIKYGSGYVRKELLASIIDNGASINGKGYLLNKVSLQFANDICFVARSLGLPSNVTKTSKGNRTIYNITIGGDVGIIPTRVKHTQAITTGKYNKTSFVVEPAGEGEYFGFTVDGNNRYLLSNFTITHNCGKTVVFSNIAKHAVENGEKVLILAHREELLKQAQEKILASTGLESEIEKAELTAVGSDKKIVIASMQTLQKDKRLANYAFDEFGTIIVDEAHHIVSPSYQKILTYFHDAKVLGVTATADRGDKQELGSYFDSIAYEYGIKKGIQEGYLSPLKALTLPIKVDLRKVKMSQGDFALGESGHALEPYLDDIAKQISEQCKNRKTVVFLPLVETANKMRDALNKYGMRAAEVDGASKDRDEVLQKFRDGTYNIITNCMLYTEGLDEPYIDCIVPLRPTKIRSLYVQCIGRGTRLYPGKTDCLILDFLWLTSTHNLVQPASLYSDDPQVVNEMAKIMAELAELKKEVDVEELTEKVTANVIAQREEALKWRLEEQRHKKAQFVDPLQFAFSIQDNEIIDYNPVLKGEKRKPTQAQLDWLFEHGINGDEVKSYGEASLIKENMLRRYRLSLTTPKQIRFLERKGFKNVGTWKFKEASEMIGRIANNKWFVPYGIDPGEYKPSSLRK